MVADLKLGTRYPLIREFKSEDLYGLYQRINTDFGGHQAFAQSLGLIANRPREWDKESAGKAILELSRKLDLGSQYPTQRQFYKNGLGDLEHRVYQMPGGHAAMAESLGLSRKNRVWNEQTAEEEITRMISKLELGERYPTHPQFRAQGVGGLYHSIERWPGGHAALAAKMGLKRSKRRTS